MNSTSSPAVTSQEFITSSDKITKHNSCCSVIFFHPNLHVKWSVRGKVCRIRITAVWTGCSAPPTQRGGCRRGVCVSVGYSVVLNNSSTPPSGAPLRSHRHWCKNKTVGNQQARTKPPRRSWIRMCRFPICSHVDSLILIHPLAANSLKIGSFTHSNRRCGPRTHWIGFLLQGYVEGREEWWFSARESKPLAVIAFFLCSAPPLL